MSSRSDALQRRGYVLFSDSGLPLREFWLGGALVDWLDEELYGAMPPKQQNGKWRGSLHPYEQVEQALTTYSYDNAFKNTGQIVNIMPQHKGIFEFKTPDVRIFGWFLEKRCFVADRGAFKYALSSKTITAIIGDLVAIRGSGAYVRNNYL
jgi:hypothetical protein